MAIKKLFGAGICALVLSLASPAHADVVRDLARLIETQGTNPLGFIQGLRSLGTVNLGEAEIRRALALLPRDVQTNPEIRRLVDPVTRISSDGTNIRIQRSTASTLGFGNRAVKLERDIRLRVRPSGSDVLIDEIRGIRAGSPQSLYRLKDVRFTTENGEPVAKVKVILNETFGFTHSVTIPLNVEAAEEALDPMAEGMDPALLTEVQSLLKTIGYDIDVDGEWGDQTESAVKAFQAAEEIEVDGQVGPQTLRHLRAAAERAGPVPAAGLTGGLDN